MKKRILAAVLALSLVLSLTSLSAFAATDGGGMKLSIRKF